MKQSTSWLSHDSEGNEIGVVPEVFEIWVPPKTVVIPCINEPVDAVVSEVKGEDADLIFYVPKQCVMQNFSYGKSCLSENSWTRPKNSMPLEDFIELSNAEPETVLYFAKRWGPLWRQKIISVTANSIPEECGVAPWVESIKDWKDEACRVKELLDISAIICHGKVAPKEKCEALIRLQENKQNRNFEIEYDNQEECEVLSQADTSLDDLTTIEGQRELLQHILNMIIVNEYDIRYGLDWSQELPKVVLNTKVGFIHAVWYQLLQSITQGNYYICDYCGTTYRRTLKKPKKGQNNYCDECRISNKGAKNAYYARSISSV